MHCPMWPAEGEGLPAEPCHHPCCRDGLCPREGKVLWGHSVPRPAQREEARTSPSLVFSPVPGCLSTSASARRCARSGQWMPIYTCAG